ncbi:MAG: hypothetical protein ACLRZG_11485 [Streptococcus sp.]
MDSHGGTPLSYAIATLKASTEDLLPLYKALLNAGAYVDERSGSNFVYRVDKRISLESRFTSFAGVLSGEITMIRTILLLPEKK